jgi:hypothetical protein
MGAYGRSNRTGPADADGKPTVLGARFVVRLPRHDAQGASVHASAVRGGRARRVDPRSLRAPESRASPSI